MITLFKPCFGFPVQPMASDTTNLVTFKNIYIQPPKGMSENVVYAAGEIWSCELESFTITLYNYRTDTFVQLLK